jgi:hypothetical protein
MITPNIVTEDIQAVQKKIKKANTTTGEDPTQILGKRGREHTGGCVYIASNGQGVIIFAFSNKIHNNLLQSVP